MAEAAYIVDGVRTAVGRYGGALSSVRPDDLAAEVLRALALRNGAVSWDRLDDIILGCANQAGEDNRNVARMAGLLAGLPVASGGVTVNRLCGSGLEAVAQAARMIGVGDADLVIAGGVESMSRAPFVMPKAPAAFSRSMSVEDTTIGWRFVNPAFAKQYGVDALGVTAENVATEYGVSRADQDAFALRSQQRAARAIAGGRFAEEIVPVTVRAGKAEKIVTTDEHPRGDVTLESLASLKPAFVPGGTVTAGNASGVNDGAAALLIASADSARRDGLRLRARVMGAVSAGVAPRVMGIGPVPAARKLMQRLGMDISDFGVIELNEAFAAQALASLRELGLPDDAAHVNPNGGAIALGHPLGMSGARLALTTVHEMERTGSRYGLCLMCIGVGQGIALALERVGE